MEATANASAIATNDAASGFRARAIRRLGKVHPTAWLTLLGVATFTVVFGALGVQHHENFGTYAFDMGIYDQGFWLVSRGESFMTVRGLDFWGHHINLIVILFVPFYWLGAGPAFLYVAQAFVIGLGAVPTYLIARDRFERRGMALVFVVVYLMYAPSQWLTHANFHPEALVITPFLFAWWLARTGRWRWFFVAVVAALSTREDTALAVMMMGVVLLLFRVRGRDRLFRVGGRQRRMAIATVLLGAGWYAIAVKLVIPFFNDWKEPFYIRGYYRNYGDSIPGVVGGMLTTPTQVMSDATRPDRLRFYRDLALPLGGMPLLSPISLLMTLPQMLASVIGLSPYARMIRYQYTSVMIAPLVISAIEGAYLVAKLRVARFVLPAWLLLSSIASNVEWSPSPIGDRFEVWNEPSARNDAQRRAVELVPDDVPVTASYSLLPQLTHRRAIFDWPNPFIPQNWGNDDCDRLPDPTTIEYVALHRDQIGDEEEALFESMTAPRGPFEIVYEDLGFVVAKRVGTSPEVDVVPQAQACEPATG